jgi:hypothetical protein
MMLTLAQTTPVVASNRIQRVVDMLQVLGTNNSSAARMDHRLIDRELMVMQGRA